MTTSSSLYERAEFRLAPLDDLHEDPANVRRHGDRNKATVRASLKEFGQVEALVVEKGTGRVLGGNCRLGELRAMGQTHAWVAEVDVHGVDATRLALALNRTAELAEWDDDALAKMLDEIGDVGDLWDDKEIDSLLSSLEEPGDVKEDEAPEADEGEPDSVPGEVYELGPHRLVCGDSKAVEPPQGSITIFDPPWDMDWEFGRSPPKQPFLAFSDGGRAKDIISAFGAPAWIFVWDCQACWWTPNRPLRRVKLALWYGDVKHYAQDGAFLPKKQKEHVAKNSRGTYNYVPNDRGTRLSDLYAESLSALHSEGDHKHEKPWDWVRALIGCCNSGSDNVYDPFAGSGSTLTASDSLGMTWTGVEIDPKTCDVIRKRWTAWADKHGKDRGSGALA